MFYRSLPRLPKMGCETIKRMDRRLVHNPVRPISDAREPKWGEKFKEMGPRYSLVWVSLGGQMKRRRVGRDKDRKDARYFWRPIEPHYQRLYMSKLRKVRAHWNKNFEPFHLRETNKELTYVSSQSWATEKKYGSHLAPPRKFDFEFRVF